MFKTWAVLKREYLTRVKTKGFVIGTIAMPLIIVLIGTLPAMFSRAKMERQQKLMVVDFSKKVAEHFKNSIEKTRLKNGTSQYHIDIVTMDSSEFEKEQPILEKKVRDDEYIGFIVIPGDIFTSDSVHVYLKNVSNFALNETMQQTISTNVRDLRITASNLDPELVKTLLRRVKMQTYKVAETGSRRESQEGAFFTSYILIFFLYMALIMYGLFVMRGVIEDKNSRVVEIVVSSLKPHQLMAGKILGIGGVGITQFLIWAITIALFSLYGVSVIRLVMPDISAFSLPTIPITTLIYFVLFFLLGFFLYATLYAGVGALVDNEADAQSLQWPVMIFLVIGFMLMFYIMPNPNSPAATVLSLVPFFSPLLMFLRISMEVAPGIEIIMAIIILLLTIWGLIWIVGRIFRVGILMYGKRPTVPELLKWLGK